MKQTQKRYYSHRYTVPALLIYGIMFILPTILSFVLSFTDWNTYQTGLHEIRFAGLDNMKELFYDRNIKTAFYNTFLFTIVVTVFKMTFSFLLALLLNAGLKCQGYLRTVFYFPCILSTVAVGMIFFSLYHPTTGLVNKLLNTFGLDFLAKSWFGDVKLVMYSISSVEIWKWTGFHMVIFLAGLQSVDREYYEAASIDGASSWQKLRFITCPLLIGAVNTNLVFCITGGLKVFEIVLATTGGGPGTSSEVLMSLVYKKFAQGFFSLSTATGLLLFIIVMAITFPMYYFLQKKEVEF